VTAPDRYIEWINAHLGFNPRSQANSNVLSDFILADLQNSCPEIAAHLNARELAPARNADVLTRVASRNVDFVLRDPAGTIRAAVEHKTIMTAHGKARWNRYGDVIAYCNHMHNHRKDCIAGATVIINVDGTSDTLGNAIYVNGVQTHGDSNLNEDILFNFADATSVDISNGLDASVLAPFALLTDNGGQIDGNFIAAQIDITGNGEAHNVEFTGTLPDPNSPASTPEPASLALMGTGLLGIAGALYRRIKA